jgi:hypothetical protein
MISDGALSFVKPVIVSCSVLAMFALARRFMRTSVEDAKLAEKVDASIPSVVVVNLVMLVVGLLFAIIVHALLVWSNRFIASKDGTALMVLYPSVAIWWFLPGFGALAVAWEITYRAWFLMNRAQAEAYRAYSNVKSGFDSTRLLRILAVVVVLPMVVATILALPIHTTLTAQAIRDGHFAKISEVVFSFADATELIQFDGNALRDGSFQPRAGVLIRFKDGRTWNSAETGDPTKQVDPRLIQLLVDRTRLPVGHVQLEPDK